MIYRLYRFYREFTLDGIIIFFFLSIILYVLCEPKDQRMSIRRFAGLGTLAYTALYLGVPMLMQVVLSIPRRVPPYWYFFLCMVVTAVIMGRLFLKSSFFHQFLYTLFFVALVQLFKIVCSPLYLQEPTMPRVLYAFFDILTTLIQYGTLFLLFRFFQRFQLNPSIQVLPKTTLFMLYFPVSLLLGGILSVAVSGSAYVAPILSAVILTNLPLIYIMVSRVISAYEEQRRLDAALAQSQAELAAYQVSADLREQLRRERHELKNKYFYIQSLLREHEYEQLNEHLDQVLGNLSETLSTLETGNTFLDYLLGRKLGEAKELGIQTRAEITLPRDLPVENEALCTILSNLLDNAIEASKQEPEPELRISMRCAQNYLICIISNRVSRNILAVNPNLQTTKGDSANHGYGTKIIRQTIEQQNGIFHIEVIDGFFVAKVMLPILQSLA